MVELKKEAVKDVTSLTKAAPVALAKTIVLSVKRMEA